MRALGIGAPETAVEVSREETPDQSIWIVKSLRDGRMKYGNAAASMRRIAVKRIPATISVAALRSHHNVYVDQRRWKIPTPSLLASVAAGLMYSWTGKLPACIPADLAIENVQQYLATPRVPTTPVADFIPPDDWSQIREAIDQASQQMLDIHAARAFLACTTAHAGNILVDANAKLYSIDHELCVATDPSEIELLKNRVRSGTRAHRAMQRIADTLDTLDVADLFEDLPKVEWPMGNRATTLAYFLKRFECWRGAHPTNR